MNRTQKDIMHRNWEEDWHYLPLIKSLTALAALFHDWGKASILFQEKLASKNKKQFKGDPLRHEWISTVFLNAYVDTDTDEQWLARLGKGEFDIESLKDKANKSAQASLGNASLPRPISKLPSAASSLAWLVLSHHRLPMVDGQKGKPAVTLDKLFRKIRQDWGYENRFNDDEFKRNLPRCFQYPSGLPSDSEHWLKAVKKQAGQLHSHLKLLEEAITNGSIRAILSHCRMSLMLGDHFYSSLNADDKKRLPSKYRTLNLHANTDKNGDFKQSLDEHLLGVAKQAERTAHFLPMFENKQDELAYTHDANALRKKSPPAFKWQDTAVEKITKWRNEQEKQNPHHFGFFTVNMASTGKGKTFANAKIMRALSSDAKRLRYVLALGLRTLTLQTGDEYRNRIGLGDDEIAVLIGSKAVLNLHNQRHKEQEQDEFPSGSASEERLLNNDIDFKSPIPEGDLKTLLRTDKDRKFLYAPVLSCTIDHLMSATETKQGGRYILPTLRLMSSDLVIDEVDDFDGSDLIAIGRLIHLAGMLGRKVMISSATIPPDLAAGYFNTYQAGWSIFSTMRNLSPIVGCAWVDENTTRVESINCQHTDSAITQYQDTHHQFISKRIDFLNKEMIKRKAEIIDCNPADLDSDVNKQDFYFKTIQKTIERLHQTHSQKDNKTNRQVSFGVVRMANITPCVALTKSLLEATTWSDDTDVRIMTYHSQQVLLMRHEQEKHLDAVLKRDGKNDQAIFTNPIIREHLDSSNKPHIIFIAVVSPVEEVGRDHDWDWAVIEPSSYRSFIQIAGRIMRHREKEAQSPNIALLQYNLKGLLGEKPAFRWPGYESDDLSLNTHNLKALVDKENLKERLDATARISKKEQANPQENLADLEHESIHQLLTNHQQHGAETLQGWISSYWWLTALPQQYVRFRDSQPMLKMYLVLTEDGDALFEKDKLGHLFSTSSEKLRRITRQESLSKKAHKRLWIVRDYRELLKELDEDKPLKYLAAIYGELSVPDRGESKFTYSSQLGLVEE